MGRFNKYSGGVGAQSRAEKKYLLGAGVKFGNDSLWTEAVATENESANFQIRKSS